MVKNVLADWLAERKKSFSCTWEGLSALTGTPFRTLQNIHDNGAIPRRATADRLIATLDDGSLRTVDVGEWVARQRSEQAGRRRRPKRREVTLKCPWPGCKKLRPTHVDAEWRRDHRENLVGRNKYHVLCDRHERERQGQLLSRPSGDYPGSLNLIYRRIERLYLAKYGPSGGATIGGRRRNARWVFDAAYNGIPLEHRAPARHIVHELLSEAYLTSALAVYHRFRRDWELTVYADQHRAEDVWVAARDGEEWALVLRAKVLSAEDEAVVVRAQIRGRQQSAKPTATTTVRRARASEKRGGAISRGQVKSWAGKRPAIGKARTLTGFRRCALPECGLIVHRRDFHDMCWKLQRADQLRDRKSTRLNSSH